MYILWEDGAREVVVIDPGEQDGIKLLDFFLETKLNPAWVFLTHEHFDHCAGVNILNRYYLNVVVRFEIREGIFLCMRESIVNLS